MSHELPFREGGLYELVASFDMGMGFARKKDWLDQGTHLLVTSIRSSDRNGFFAVLYDIEGVHGERVVEFEVSVIIWPEYFREVA